MFMAKKNRMYIDVKGVDGRDNDRRELMKEIVRRNCEVDPRIIDSMVSRSAVYGEKSHEKFDYHIELENYNFAGIVKDFELLKKAGIIEHVTKSMNYIVY